MLITRKEHGAGTMYTESDLVELPQWSEGMFENSGFSVKIRKRTEGVWLHDVYKTLVSSAEAG